MDVGGKQAKIANFFSIINKQTKTNDGTDDGI